MVSLSLEKKILYSSVFCAYRRPTPRKIECRHEYSFGICDLDLCPLVQEHYANIIFLPEGITLVIKRPGEKVAGDWVKIPLEITLDNEEKIIELIKREAKSISRKNMDALIERVHRIYKRYRFLKERGKEIPILEEKEEETEEELEEETIGEGIGNE